MRWKAVCWAWPPSAQHSSSLSNTEEGKERQLGGGVSFTRKEYAQSVDALLENRQDSSSC